MKKYVRVIEETRRYVETFESSARNLAYVENDIIARTLRRHQVGVPRVETIQETREATEVEQALTGGVAAEED